ncbi:hypothetical protein [Neobacillus mesonae]|uniref:hypothetical protein n=1 Tax=Neobacillus mesonae TaxID=1193713 RepID=UPI0025741421|nr:hypothetical protein [Neobacillus mesonae]MED4203651.1 hypothetical protein [Neobacillus mesonae]
MNRKLGVWGILFVAILLFSTMIYPLNGEAKALSTKTYKVLDTKLKPVTLKVETVKKRVFSYGYEHYAYQFSIYKGKTKIKQKIKYSDSFKSEDANAYATVTVINYKSSPSLIIFSKEHNGWPFVDGIYSVVNGKLAKVKIKGEIGTYQYKFIGKNKIKSQYFDRFNNKEYIYNATFNSKTNTLTSKVVKTRKGF